ncbi:MAG: C-GCAxxG-C-C family protein [Desulfobacteraceae bacterium]
MQDALGDKDDDILRAVTGLEGGCVACGSTCGVATGGILGVGLMLEGQVCKGSIDDRAVLCAARDFMGWFHSTHGSSICRERTSVDFYKIIGQIRYMLSPHKIMGCMRMTGRTINHLAYDDLPEPVDVFENGCSAISCEDRHCAREVFQMVRERTGIGNHRLERIAVVLDGGVGLQGELCGALAAAVMAMNLKFGYDSRSTGYSSNLHAFLQGHLNLVRETTDSSFEVFALGKGIVSEFTNRFGSVNCKKLTGTSFDNVNEFSSHIQQSDICHEIMDFSASLAVRVLSGQN